MGFFGLAVMAWPWRAPAGPAVAAATQVRMNRAGPAELASLPGIGPVLAQRIVEDRHHRGFFLTVEDLGRVKGISPKVLKKLERMVRFD
ncbi:MAG: helix-hairpin-helix domain-containing protein [Candidatus Omnitrophica bacterium]|nr:helix-hairpin-helix domain-containing protein [Candidatus Omnitrophota bacterium]